MGPKVDKSKEDENPGTSGHGGGGPILKSSDMTIKLKGWDGSGGAADCIRFIRRVETVKRTGNLSDAKTASAALAVLTGAVENYVDRFVMREDDRISEWPTLKQLLKDKYCKPMTVADLERMVSALYQKKGEPVADFRDRCELAYLTQDLTLPEAQRNTAGYGVFLDLRVKQQFLKGMRHNIRQHLGNLDPDNITLELKKI